MNLRDIANILSFLRNGAQTPVAEDTVNPANSTPLPVKLTSASGDIQVNTTNLALEVQTTAFGASPDSMQIADGTNTLKVNADGSINALIAAPYDMVVMTYGGNGLVSTAQYYLVSVLQRTLTYTYDGNDNVTQIVAS